MTSEREIAKYFLDVPRANAHHIARMSIARAMRAVAPQARGDLVDIGCGLRPYQSLFAPHIGRYIGIDYPPTGSDRTQIDATIYADSTHLPLRDRCADTVLTTQVLEHVPEPLRMLREAHRVLRPGGKLIMTAPFVWGEHETPQDFYRYTSYGLRYLLGRASLRVLDVFPLDGLYAVLGQMYLDELNIAYHNAVTTGTAARQRDQFTGEPRVRIPGSPLSIGPALPDIPRRGGACRRGTGDAVIGYNVATSRPAIVVGSTAPMTIEESIANNSARFGARRRDTGAA